MKELRKLRGAIVGLGSIGQRHCRNLERLGVAPPVVVRRPQGRNPAFTPPPGASVATSDAEAIAAGIDFALICNPTRFHVAAARQYLAAGVAVLVEKPISDRQEDARQLVEESLALWNDRLHGVLHAISSRLRRGAGGGSAPASSAARSTRRRGSKATCRPGIPGRITRCRMRRERTLAAGPCAPSTMRSTS